jgi:hypothetical protein
MTITNARQDLLPFHPLANTFPLMNGAEFNELVADVKRDGLREKITLYQGKVLDGRNRAPTTVVDVDVELAEAINEPM